MDGSGSRAHDETVPTVLDRYDVLVMGAGAAGGILVSRLSGDPELLVALLQAGPEIGYDIGRSQGAFFLTWGGEKGCAYTTVQQEGLGGRVVAHPRGRVVGGSTALNVGAWRRGCPEDCDAWKAAGADGWNGPEALRVFQNVEGSERGVTDPLRGADCAIRMSDLGTPTSLPDPLQTACVDRHREHGDHRGDAEFLVHIDARTTPASETWCMGDLVVPPDDSGHARPEPGWTERSGL